MYGPTQRNRSGQHIGAVRRGRRTAVRAKLKFADDIVCRIILQHRLIADTVDHAGKPVVAIE